MRLISFGLALAICLVQPVSAEPGRRVALVIGNNAYAGTKPLANPVNDATAIAEKLKLLDFEVILATDIDRVGTIAAIGQFSRAIDGAGIALFFFAGHGMQLGGQNLLLPTDVSVESEWALRSSAIEAQEIVAEMERRAEVSIAILDACRDNPYVDVAMRSIDSDTRSVAIERGLGPMRLTGRGALIAYAAAAGDVAADGTGSHSPFTAALLEEIDEPNIEVGLMFRHVARRVRDETAGDQHPELLVRLVDEAYLNATVTPTASSPVNSVPEAVAASAASQVVAGVSRKAAPGRLASADKRFFGARVVHQPAWSTDIDAPRPSGWRSAAPEAIVEAPDNDSFGRAQTVSLATEAKVRITPRGDADWFRVDVPTAGELRVTTNGQPAELDISARVLNADGRDITGWQGAPKKGADLEGRFALPEPGAYWIQVADGNNDGESSAAFTVSLDFIAADDPFEPNGSMAAAAPLPVDVTLRPSIFPRGDTDWFKVWIPEPGLLQILATEVPDVLDVAVQVFDLNRKSLSGWIGPDRKGGDTVFDARLPEPGTYIIEVADSNGDAAATEPFALDFAFTAVADVAEPNDDFGQAVIVAGSGDRKAAIFPRGDTDWLAIDVDHPGELQLLASKSPKDLDINFQVFDANKQSLTGWIPPIRKGGDNELSVDLPEPGRFFIEIADGNSDASSPDLFDLSLHFVAQPDQYEPNNAPTEAVPLTLGGKIPFNILPRGDNDWFQIEVPAPGELSILIEESAENLDINFQVLNADVASLGGWVPPYRKGGVAEGFTDLPAPGVYYIQIADGNNDARSIDPATLVTAFASVADAALEPNDSFGNAVPLKLGEPVIANILPRGDADWYAIEAPRAGSFVVTVDEVDEDLDIAVSLWDADVRGGSWIGPSRKGGVTEAALAVPAAGIYHLAVADSNNDARSVNPYRILVEFE